MFSRKSGESFFIGADIEILILEVQNDKVKVGISAPETIAIVRKELKEIAKANLDAANSQGTIRGNIFKN